MADKNWFSVAQTTYSSSSQLEPIISNLEAHGYHGYSYGACARCCDCVRVLGNCGKVANTCALQGISFRWSIATGDPYTTSSGATNFCDTVNAAIGEVNLFVPRNFLKINSTRCESCTSFQI